MKKISLLIFTLLFFIQVIAQHHYQVKGDFHLNTDDNKLFLKVWKDVPFWEAILDSFIIKNNQFQFDGEMPYQTSKAKIFFKSASKFEFFDFIIDEGMNTISFQKGDSPSSPIFSKTEKPLSVSNEIYSRIDSIYQYYLSKYGSYTEDLTNGGQIFVLNHSDKNGEQNRAILNLISKYPNSFYSLMKLYGLIHSYPFRDDPTDLMRNFYLFSPEIQGSILGRKFYEECNFKLSANRASKIGKHVPEFEVGTFNGVTFRTSDMVGKSYILSFSATWCIPCQHYKELLVKLYKKYKEDGLQIVYFNLDDDVGRWKKEIEKLGLDWIFVSEKVKFENSQIAKSFNVFSIPSYFVIDKNGLIKYNSNELKDMDFTQLESVIKNELKK